MIFTINHSYLLLFNKLSLLFPGAVESPHARAVQQLQISSPTAIKSVWQLQIGSPAICDTSDDDSAGFECDELEDDLDDMTLDDKFEEMGEEEKREKNYISNYLEDFADEEDIFSAAEVEA